jgi:hemerythrin superfamily protein
MTDVARNAEGGDVVTAVLDDHRRIEGLMADVSVAGPDKEERFRALVETLAVHETAEEEVVHPLTRRTAGGDPLVERRLEEESHGKESLAELERMGVDAPGFEEAFDRVRRAVLDHAQHEEQEELPQLRRAVDEDRLERAAGLFRAAERVGPTHAHAHAPESATGNLLVGTFVAAADRARDALRRAGTSEAPGRD